jgi:hypothetical protein
MKQNSSAGRFRSRLTYANVIATLSLFIALGGVSWAATSLPKNSVTSKAIKKGAVTNAKIKRSAVTSSSIRNSTITNSDIKNSTITGAKLNLSSLGTVPSATTAGTAGTASDQFSVVRPATPSASNSDPNVARAAATEIPLASNSQISIYAKCFVDPDVNEVYAEVYSRTTANGAIQGGYSISDALDGNPSLNTNTAEDLRQISDDSVTPNGTDNDYGSNVSVLGPDAKGLYFSVQTYVRSGAVADAPALLSGTQSCLFHVNGTKTN